MFKRKYTKTLSHNMFGINEIIIDRINLTKHNTFLIFNTF